MPVAWRIVKTKHTNQAFDGDGARLFGGHWNSRGVPMIYTAGSPSAALLEMLVNSHFDLARHYHLYRIDIPDGLVKILSIHDLPHAWRTFPAPPELANIGDSWARGAESATLAVPNAVMPLETNYLLNPSHADFQHIAIAGPVEYSLDARLMDQ